jgi:hypothetical protein
VHQLAALEVEMVLVPPSLSPEFTRHAHPNTPVHHLTAPQQLVVKKGKLQGEVTDLKLKLSKSISIAQQMTGRLSEERRRSGKRAITISEPSTPYHTPGSGAQARGSSYT